MTTLQTDVRDTTSLIEQFSKPFLTYNKTVMFCNWKDVLNDEQTAYRFVSIYTMFAMLSIH